MLCPGLLGAGPADRSWHPDPSGALTPGGTSHSPSMLCTFLLNYFFYYHCFCPCSDGCQCRGGGGEQSRVELFSLPAGLAPASWQGSNFPKVSTFPGTPCREPACAPLWQEGKLPKTRFRSRDGHVQPGHSPLPYPSLLPSWRRASPTVTRPSCATCLLRQMRWERDGSERAECRGGGGSSPDLCGLWLPKTPGGAWHLGVPRASWGGGEQ